MISAARANRLENTANGLPGLLCSPSLALTLAAFFWAGSFVVGRALRDDIDPVTLTFSRWLISLLIFVPFVLREVVAHFRVVLRE